MKTIFYECKFIYLLTPSNFTYIRSLKFNENNIKYQLHIRLVKLNVSKLALY